MEPATRTRSTAVAPARAQSPLGTASPSQSPADSALRSEPLTAVAYRLIKRATGPMDLRPSDLLIERFSTWKTVCGNMISYFEGAPDFHDLAE